MNTNDLFVLLIIALAFFGGVIVGASIREKTDRKLAIEHHAAHYNPTNAAFEWNK